MNLHFVSNYLPDAYKNAYFYCFFFPEKSKNIAKNLLKQNIIFRAK